MPLDHLCIIYACTTPSGHASNYVMDYLPLVSGMYLPKQAELMSNHTSTYKHTLLIILFRFLFKFYPFNETV